MADLSRLLCPRSIAVIGGGWGAAVLEQCRKAGFGGALWAVHPTRAEIAGVATVPRIEDLPAAPDAAFIGINRHATVAAVQALAARGAGGAVCFASGFAEAEDGREAGAALQAELVSAAGEMPILGPNCYGLINYLDGALLWPDQHGGARVDRGVAIVGQSSNILLNLTMQRRGLPISHVVAAGNQAQTGLAGIAAALLADHRVSAIGLHVEAVGDVRAFEALAGRARERRVPIVALKTGRSEQARAAAVSHTASLTGGDAAGRAFLNRLAIPVVETLPVFLETLKLLHVHGPLPGTRLGSMSCSGGEAGLAADAGARAGVSFPPPDAAARARIGAALGDLVTVANPLDYHTFIWNDRARLEAAYRAMLESGHDLDLLILDFPREDRCDGASWRPSVDALAAAARHTGARAAVVATLPENLPEAEAAAIMGAGIAPLAGLDEALSAAGAAALIHARWSQPPPLPVTEAPANGRPQLVDEFKAKGWLAHHGVSVPACQVARTPEEAGQMAEALGFPVALKALGHAHKTESGAVRLNLTSGAEVEEEAGWMPGGGPFLVECMVAGGVAELLVGFVRDPVHGFTLTMGAGGVMSEVMQDTATLMVPAVEDEIRAALAGLRIARVLSGWRGRPAVDLTPIVHAVMAMQGYVIAHAPHLVELEVNPLIVLPGQAVAADALLRLAGVEEEQGCCG